MPRYRNVNRPLLAHVIRARIVKKFPNLAVAPLSHYVEKITADSKYLNGALTNYEIRFFYRRALLRRFGPHLI